MQSEPHPTEFCCLFRLANYLLGGCITRSSEWRSTLELLRFCAACLSPRVTQNHACQVVARLLKFNNEVVYEHLLTPEVPFALDYFEVVFSLCEVMSRIYAKFEEEVRCDGLR